MRITIHRKALIVVGLMIAVFMVGSITGYALVKAVPQQPQTQVQAQSGSSVYGGWINVYTSYILYLQLQDAGSSRVTVTLTEFVCQSATAYSNGQFTTYTKYLHGLIKGNGIDLEWPTDTAYGEDRLTLIIQNNTLSASNGFDHIPYDGVDKSGTYTRADMQTFNQQVQALEHTGC